MLTVKEAIERRRSIRKFKSDPVPDEIITRILEAARLAPSGNNRQPWRFQVVKEGALKKRLIEEATFGNEALVNAPVIIACGSEMLAFVKGHPLSPPGAQWYSAESEDPEETRKFIPDAHMYTAIAITHMTLMATALGLGTCWVQRIKHGQAARVLGWPRRIPVLTFLALGYPNEDPPPRPRVPLDTIILKESQMPQ